MSEVRPSQAWTAASVFFVVASVCLGTYVLWIGSGILIPIVIAGLVWFALVSLARLFIGVLPPFPGRTLLAHLAAWLLLIVVSRLIYSVLSQSVVQFQRELPSYQGRLVGLGDGITSFLTNLSTGSLSFLNLEVPNVGQFTEVALEQVRASIPDLAGSLISATQSGLVLVVTVLIYLVFFYAESSSFPRKLAALNREEADHNRWSTLIGFIISRISTYLRIKTFTSALTGGLGLILMLSLGVNFAIVFALLLFLLNYIPTIGSLISSLLPLVLYLVDPSATLTKWLILAGGLLAIQQGIGALLEPRLLANSFNISSILIMTSLLFWGSIWGVFGMLISAPIMAALVILLANFQGSRQLAILLSANGDVDSLRPSSNPL